MGKEVYAQIACVPKRVSKVNSILKQEENDPREVFISKTCFNGLLFVKPQTVKVDPILCLIRQWDRSRECFVLDGGHEWVFTDENVALVYGLPHGFGKSPIQIDSKYDHYSFADEFVEKYSWLFGGNKYIKHNVLEGLLLGGSINIGADCIDYWRFYVLYALCSLLIPLSSSSISYRYLKFLESPEIAESYNWAGLVKDKLVEGLNAYRSKMDRDDAPNARPTGDLHCLMHLFYDFLNSRQLVGRCYTCAFERDLNFQDLHKVFPHLNGLKEEVDGKGKGIMMIKAAPQVNTKDDFLRKKEKYEKEIVRCDDLIEKCAKKKEHMEACLKKLLEDHSGRAGGDGEGMESTEHEGLEIDNVGDIPNTNGHKVAEISCAGAGLRNENVEDVPNSNEQKVAEISSDGQSFLVGARLRNDIVDDVPNPNEQKVAEISSDGQSLLVGAGLRNGIHKDVPDLNEQELAEISSDGQSFLVGARLTNDNVEDVPNPNEHKVAEISSDSQSFLVGAGLRNDIVEDVPNSNEQKVAEISSGSQPCFVGTGLRNDNVEDVPNMNEQKVAEIISDSGQPSFVGAGSNEGVDARDPKRQRIEVEQTGSLDRSLHSSLSMNIAQDLAAKDIPEIQSM